MLRILATPWREFARLYSSVAFVRLAVLGIGLGVVSGCAAMLFFLGIEYAKHLILVAWAGLSLPAPAGRGDMARNGQSAPPGQVLPQ